MPDGEAEERDPPGQRDERERQADDRHGDELAPDACRRWVPVREPPPDPEVVAPRLRVRDGQEPDVENDGRYGSVTSCGSPASTKKPTGAATRPARRDAAARTARCRSWRSGGRTTEREPGSRQRRRPRQHRAAVGGPVAASPSRLRAPGARRRASTASRPGPAVRGRARARATPPRGAGSRSVRGAAPRGRAPPSRAASTAARDGTSPPTSLPPGRRRRTRPPRDGGPLARPERAARERAEAAACPPPRAR